jgi:hypothetical protein
MDDVLAGWFTDSEMQGIYRCRLYLQVECLSDIYVGIVDVVTKLSQYSITRVMSTISACHALVSSPLGLACQLATIP